MWLSLNAEKIVLRSHRTRVSLRFRRDAVHDGIFKLLSEHILSGAAVARGITLVEAWLEEQARQEDAALREGVQSPDIRRLDEEAVALRGMTLRPAAIAAGLAAIEKERAELLTRARGGNRGANGHRHATSSRGCRK